MCSSRPRIRRRKWRRQQAAEPEGRWSRRAAGCACRDRRAPVNSFATSVGGAVELNELIPRLARPQARRCRSRHAHDRRQPPHETRSDRRRRPRRRRTPAARQRFSYTSKTGAVVARWRRPGGLVRPVDARAASLPTTNASSASSAVSGRGCPAPAARGSPRGNGSTSRATDQPVTAEWRCRRASGRRRDPQPVAPARVEHAVRDRLKPAARAASPSAYSCTGKCSGCVRGRIEDVQVSVKWGSTARAAHLVSPSPLNAHGTTSPISRGGSA